MEMKRKDASSQTMRLIDWSTFQILEILNVCAKEIKRMLLRLVDPLAFGFLGAKVKER